ncbi:hypothetical protein [Phytohabitans houttuyneae]|uniref:Uncharacterized protein n=1 Tax=Phytohabitans houttuyneae TaxID=1076126 RepID=A0A6V8KD22_9ACTN|nr:hypothetical protein [Phytohabitans houttuyneae]GFJ79577.1 hypothetical protein Phou_037570 [Phytohabitans houttuyneae]
MEEWRVRDSRTDLRRDASSLYTDNGELAVVDAGSGLSHQKCAAASGWRGRIGFADLARGSQLCVRTGNARYAGVVVRSLPNPENPHAVIAGYTWR